MQKTNNISPKYLFLILAFIALNLITVGSKGKNIVPSSTFLKTLSNNSFNSISSKKDHFSVAEKQNLFLDTLPQLPVPFSDTIPTKKINTKNEKDTTKQKDTLNYKLAKNAIESKITYTAEDSMVLDVDGKKVTLFGKKATTNYNGNKITSPIIILNQETGDISAFLKRDSTGKPIFLPRYESTDFTSESDSFRFNMKTGKGITKSTYTQQGEMYVYAQVIKKMDNDVIYALRGRFTTCNLDTPHFAFISNKIKFITNNVAISGPVHPEFEGVPIPIYFPFGIYPLNQGRHSGFLPPNFTTNQQKGLGLEGLGFYKVVNDNWDVILRGSVYSYGGWSLNVNPRYSKRYHYSGTFSFDIQHFNYNFKGDPDFQKNRSYKILWSHTADMRARPGVLFSANVNAGSSSYNSMVPNDPYLNFSNQMYSSIAYSKTWKDKPFMLQLTANHDQNTQLKLINISLPSVSFNMSTIYPFRKKEFAGTPKWYENIGIGYIGTAQNRFSFYDTLKTKSIFQQIRDTLQWGAQHQIPISISLPQMGIFQISPGISYQETWFQRKSTHYWDNQADTLRTKIDKGFYTARDMSFSLGISTRIFGMIVAKKKDALINAIRHEMRPSLSFNYRPDFNKQNYYTTVVDTAGNKQQFSYFENQYNIYAPYSPGTFGGLSFSLDNNISMKVRNRKDTGDNALKKISILDQLSLQGSYNFVADSFRFSPISLNASTNLFNKVNISGGANWNLYEVDNTGRPIDVLIWKRHPISLGRLTDARISLSSQFKGGGEKKDDKKGNGFQPGQIPSGYSTDEYNSEMAYIRNNPGEYADFSIPWSLNLSYSFFYSKMFVQEKGFQSTVTQNIQFGGTLNLTEKWQMGVNGYYNIGEGQLNPLSLSVSRDMHCWQMSISISPLGYYRYFSINISPKSPLLRDLKINKTRSFNNYNF
jgi:lipopolysaccharide assembly outer membrane protein LptD (OstA)